MPGDARAIAHFMHRLAGRHEIALVYLARRMSRRWMRKSRRSWLMPRDRVRDA
jgi:hypothetical protein